MALPRQLTPAQVKQLLDEGKPIVLLDVREPQEVALVRIAGAVHIPMGEIPGRLHELDPEADIVVYCHHGMRSASAAEWLRARGLARVRNLAGGIDRWSTEVDARVPRY